MAAWQVQFYLVGPTRLPPDIRRRLEQVLPRDTLDPAHAFERWGSHASDCIEILEDYPACLSARFDMRAPDANLTRRFLAFVREAGLQLQDDEGLPVAPVLAEFRRVVSESSAFRWLREPALFLRALEIAERGDV